MKKNSELFEKIVVVKRKVYLKSKADHYHKAFYRSKIVHCLNVSWLENSDKIEMLLKLSAY